MKNSEIKSITAREILDSRGMPTVEATVILNSGAVGVCAVPSGASTGSHEARELRDGGKRFGGMGVLSALTSVNTRIAPALIGVSALDRQRVDSIMIALDGTRNKSNLGANSILSVSLAVCRAAAAHMKLPLYRYLGGERANNIPVPMMNILNGGAHADNNIDIQEFMIVPHGAESAQEAVRMGAEVYRALKASLKTRGLSTAVGDEGGFAPMLKDEDEALSLICEAIESAGYRCGEDISLALDVAASEWYSEKEGIYRMPKRGIVMTAEEQAAYIGRLVDAYPIISVEDGMAEDDIEGWKLLNRITERKKLLLVGDDLFVTNRERVAYGVSAGIANTVLIKPKQIGTVSEAMDAVLYATGCGYKTVMSHRSGETADSFISDFAVAMGCQLIKAGAPCRSERTEKYNRLTAIESELFAPTFSGADIF